MKVKATIMRFEKPFFASITIKDKDMDLCKIITAERSSKVGRENLIKRVYKRFGVTHELEIDTDGSHMR